jgi:ATP phosphoribosyltransferase
MDKLKIAIQKSGRLSEDSLGLIKKCGIKLNLGKSSLKAECLNFPAEILFLRDDDIPQYVQDGVADLGIVGENVLVEKNKQISLIKELGFSKCRLSLAVPRDLDYSGISYFNNKKIATSYPNLLNQYLSKHNISAEIHEISGSVEIAPGIGLAEGICDIVSTGSTLLSNGLKEVEQIFNSQAVLIANKNLSASKQELTEKLLFRISAVNKARDTKYVLLNAPNEKIDEISNILPGVKSPTVMPLAEPGWSSLHSVVEEKAFWEIIDKLKEAGAQGILVIPVEKMIV